MKAIIFATDTADGDLLRQAFIYIGMDAVSYLQMEPVLQEWSGNAADLVLLADDQETAPIPQIRQIREATQMPLLVITETPSEAELCTMLQAGADLILPRPVSPRILTNYAQVLLRRVDTVPQSFLNSFEMVKFSLDPANRTATVAGHEPQRLTRLEFRLLYVLVANREQVMALDFLIERVWGYDSRGDHELLRGLISRVRHKIEPDLQNPQFIENLPGIGYRFTTEMSANG